MKALSLFSGIGGIDLACEWAGIETVAFCEREPFCQKVLRKHWPEVPIYDDVCTLTKERLEADGIWPIELIHGGYPCQPFSVAGKREGKDDDRHLWPEMFRLIQTLQPRWFVGENVAGHVTLGLDIVLSDLERIGYAWEAFVIPACAVYARHRRDRVFIVAHSTRQLPYGSGAARDWRSKLANGGEIVAYTEGERRGKAWQLQPERAEKRSASCSQTIPDPNSERCEEFNIAAGGERMGFDSRGTPSGRLQWAVEPGVGRVANGVSDRAHRLKALGNAVVPQQIYPILAAIKQIDDMIRAN
jgi:DNA (cytosine-5)-methyltransferase 1